MSEHVIDELKLRKEGESVIISDASGIVFSDFAPFREPPSGKPHLLDVIDADDEQDVLRIVGLARDEHPGEFVESDCVFRKEKIHLRVIHSLSSEPRTCVFIAKGAGPTTGV